MKVYSIANTPSFGYNKAVNDEANALLAKHSDDEFCSTLLQINKFTNNLEDKIRAAEAARRKGLVKKYMQLFLPMKDLVAGQIEFRFPKLNYLNTEMNSYFTEVKRRGLEYKAHWINDLLEDLEHCADMIEINEAAIAVSRSGILNDEEELINEPEKVPVKSQQQPVPAEKATDAISEAKNHNLELFVPNEDTPKGFVGLGGMNDVKDLLTEKIIMPLNNPEEAALDLFEYGKKLPKGVLFYGPPGCGKSAVIEALAIETGLPLYNLKISNTGSPYVNKSATNTQDAYDYAKKIAKDTGKPVLLRIDELETYAPKRVEKPSEDNKIVGVLLQIIDDARANNVIMLCTTNHYNRLDSALTSRLEDRVYIGLPDVETREKVLNVLLNKFSKGKELANNPKELHRLAEMTDGFSNRNLVQLTDMAAMIAKNDGRRNIKVEDYVKPIEENQNMKVNEDEFRDKSPLVRKPIGFNSGKK